MLQGNLATAIHSYTQALAIDPGNFKALFNRGFCLDKTGDHDGAIADYTAALDVDALNSFAFYNRGIAKDRKGDFKGAVADFTTAILLSPDNSDFYHNRGFSLRKQVHSTHYIGLSLEWTTVSHMGYAATVKCVSAACHFPRMSVRDWLYS